ncbi:hypothetical protein EP47_00565 [Legionella norrlandica]|uniref:Uncharacterized protein n=1 Tax=Legionella norrlandica TaxID=1498499 RepID=A0A0A2SUF2_9GAMM|nr:hypothetical protein [Legionella norrlandica]KGP64367.1 hypothetical protein EP47_00565 [Legionella norrlandica]
MTQNTPILSNWFVTENYRAKAQIKYQLKYLESRLGKCFDQKDEDFCFSKEIHTLCITLANKYLDYLKLLDIHCDLKHFLPSEMFTEKSWPDIYQKIGHLKQKLSVVVDLREEAVIIAEISFLYKQIAILSEPEENSSSWEYFDELRHLFKKENIKLWLSTVVDVWNQKASLFKDPIPLFRGWALNEQQEALNFFSEPDLVNLVNAIFFYKLYPDKLFNELIHPEKLVSVRMRLGFLHDFIELLQRQLHNNALQYGLNPGVDFLFHGDELHQGILFEVNEVYKEIIQLAIKNLKVPYTPENNEKVTLERLHDLSRAYKFWFNPNRLIDAVMVLQQRLVKEGEFQDDDLAIFHQEMLILFHQLTTTECMDLYGYFANKDSRYLLYTLYSITIGRSLDWLPTLNAIEKNAIEKVYNALRCVMEALRVELKNRCITTEPYVYDLGKKNVQARRRNREAVFRIIAIYGCETRTLSKSLEKLFGSIEEASSQ